MKAYVCKGWIKKTPTNKVPVAFTIRAKTRDDALIMLRLYEQRQIKKGYQAQVSIVNEQ